MLLYGVTCFFGLFFVVHYAGERERKKGGKGELVRRVFVALSFRSLLLFSPPFFFLPKTHRPEPAALQGHVLRDSHHVGRLAIVLGGNAVDIDFFLWGVGVQRMSFFLYKSNERPRRRRKL